ncbi:Prophage antirepressor [Oceanobacillus limi]|uniref:Prophage antirepressor n=1 Tax=Oceanobacillus limi TaxID=930131 RepID=A0A1I0GZN2_9BACI|nr:ORF6C domain-containing protein [Oceanobacillus limi]SET76720.1 Prophage antirepressor [Oceanobacillus limi]
MNQLIRMFDDQQLRIIEQNEVPWFLLNDLVKILGLSNSRMVKDRLADDVSSTYPIQDSLGRTQQATFVNEDGLYDVILDSRKPEAKRFRKWITSEVLPSIRKTGMYQAPKNELEVIQQTVNQMVRIDNRVSDLENNMRIDGAQEHVLNKKGRQVVMEVLGGKSSPAYKNMAFKLFSAFWRDFKNHFEIPRYGDLPKKKFEDGLRFIGMWQPSTSLKIEIDEINNQQTYNEVI